MRSDIKSNIMRILKIDESWIIAEADNMMLSFVQGNYDHYRVTLSNHNMRNYSPFRIDLINMAIDARSIIGNDNFTECTENIFKVKGDPRLIATRGIIINIVQKYVDQYVEQYNNIDMSLPCCGFNLNLYRYITVLYSILFSDDKRKEPDPIAIKLKNPIEIQIYDEINKISEFKYISEFNYMHKYGAESIYGRLVTIDAIRRTRYIHELKSMSNPAEEIDSLYKKPYNEKWNIYLERIGNMIGETHERMKTENLLLSF